MEVSPSVEPIARLRRELDALDLAYSPGHHGRWSARRRAESFDAAIGSLFDAAEPPAGVVIAAVGGYGRMQQLPRSDVDLLIVHDGRAAGQVEQTTERVLYPLWDAKLEVGHAVRTPIECEAIAAERLDALTSMLDVRAIAGDDGLATEVRERVRALAASDVAAFARTLEGDIRDREQRFGAATHLLEPDLKNGAGGLRDVQAVRWITSIAGDALVRTAERQALDDAEEFLTRARSALHLEAGRRTDRLPLELQGVIADAMGFVDEPRLIAEDGLMRAVFEHARSARWISGNVLLRAARGSSMPTETPSPFGDVAEALEALATVAERGERPDAGLLDSAENTPVPMPVEWSERLLTPFLRIVRTGEHGVAALDVLDRLSWLPSLLPAWADVRCRPQRDPYHRYTVDTHLTRALAEMARLCDQTPEMPDRDGLLLGALFHDIGKIGAGRHVEEGSRVASETLDRMGVVGATRDLAAFMVAEHLLLPDTATRRDLTDEDLILDVAARIETPERLRALHLLAQADAAATGPAASTPWRQTLVRELVSRIERVYARGHMGVELAHRLTSRVEAVRSLLASEPEAAVDRFVLRMPRGYFLSVEPDRVAAHYPMIAPDVGSTEVRSSDWPAAEPGTYELLVVAGDRPGLLSFIAGAMALTWLSILSAKVFTTDDQVAVDLFEVEGSFEAEITPARWRELRSTIRGAVEGRISLDHRVAEKRARYPAPRSRAPVTVEIDNDASDYSTIVEVGGPDRIGLLYDITSVLAELTLDVHLAKVATYEGRVIDAFYVRDPLGRKVTDVEQVHEIASAVSTRLGGERS